MSDELLTLENAERYVATTFEGIPTMSRIATVDGTVIIVVRFIRDGATFEAEVWIDEGQLYGEYGGLPSSL